MGVICGLGLSVYTIREVQTNSHSTGATSGGDRPVVQVR